MLETLIAPLILLCAATGQEVTVEDLAARFASRDVIFLGEEHDNTAGHAFQLAAIQALAARAEGRPIVISMEMFERDVQAAVDDYLAGRIDEATFLEHSRPWGNYAEHYRPIIEWAKANRVPVLAANAPRNDARRVAFRGLEGLTDRRHVARKTTAPDDRYLELFKATMDGHVGVGNDEAMRAMYVSQCLKDDTMAEAIADYLAARPWTRPLVIHLCGKFHSDYGLGTVVRLLERRPLVQIGVVSMISSATPSLEVGLEERQRGHFVAVVPEEPKASTSLAAAVAAAALEESGTEVAATEPAGVEAPSEQPAAEAPVVAPTGRPALGVMPAYGDDQVGVLIEDVVPDGGAERAGLEGGDRILAINGEEVRDLEDYMSVLETLKPGQTVPIKYRRGEEEKTTKVTLGTRH